MAHSLGRKTGVLLSNLGTPDAPTAVAVRRYLAEFLSDRRIVSLPRWLWWPILYGVILRVRPRRSAHAYSTVWTEEGSPLLVITERQAEAMRQRLLQKGYDEVIVAVGMRYGRPSIATALEALHQAGVEQIIVLPLYPQFSVTTTASTFDAVSQHMQGWMQVPHLHMMMDYHRHPDYITALANSVHEHWQQHGRSPCLLFSFHGTPEALRTEGDPYYDQCHETVRLLVERLSLKEDEWRLTFQSRFGYQSWLQPYTDATLTELAQQGVQRVDVMCPGFSADCLETLEEIKELNKSVFTEAGGQEFHYIAALNERYDHIDALLTLIQPYLDGAGLAEGRVD